MSVRSSFSITWARGFRAGSGIDVRPHPHIGLATVTYLFEGEILHRDSSARCRRSHRVMSTG